MKYVEVYWTGHATKGREWRWRMKSRNGRILAVSSESYRNKAYAGRLEQAGDGMHQYLMDEYGTQHLICMIHWREEKGRTA